MVPGRRCVDFESSKGRTGELVKTGVEVVDETSGLGIDGLESGDGGESDESAAESGSGGGDDAEGAVQTMNVSLSASVRQDFCMAYSSGKVRGSEAVACCSSSSCIHSWYVGT